MILAAVLAVLFYQAPEAPVVRLQEIVLEGVTAFSRDEVLKGIRLHPGGRFFRDPEEIAASLATFYELKGYVAPRVAARFEREAGRLTLTVGEARLQSIVLEGVEGDEEARVRALLALDTGVAVQEKAINDAIGRLEAATGGAYTVERGMGWTVDDQPEGRVLRLRVVHRRFHFRPLLYGPDASPYKNRVEGRAPGAGLDVTVFGGTSPNHLSVYGSAAYGFSSDAWRYAVGARRSFGAERLLTVGYELHDLTDTDDIFRRRPFEGPRDRPIPFHSVDDYYRRHGQEAYVFLRPTPRVNLGVNFRADTHASMPVVDDDAILLFRREPRPNPAVGEGRMRSFLFTARWARHDALFPTINLERDALLLRTPYGTAYEHSQGARVEGTYEVSSEGLGSDFSFQRLTGQARASRPIGTRHVVIGRVLAGLTGGTPPPQRTIALGGLGTLRGYSLKEFTGEQAVLGTVEWTMRTRPWFPSVVAFADGGSAWGGAISNEAGFKADAGVGLTLDLFRRGWARMDVAFPLQPSPGADKVRVYGMLRLPF